MSKARKKSKPLHPLFQKRLRDAANWIAGHDKGSRKGHASQAAAADARAKAIRSRWSEMEAAGEHPTNDTVAAAMKCSRSTVIRAFKAKPATAPPKRVPRHRR